MAITAGAHAFFIEHRYYGKSLPFGPNASFTAEGLRYLTIEQALADDTEVINALPAILGCQGTGARKLMGRCDVILFGGSYGGMLAAWHRLKYPFLSVGAIASGAPVDFYPGNGVQQAFRDATAESYRRYGGRAGCDDALRDALAAADSATTAELAAAGVRPCAPWTAASTERYAFYARGALASIAMADYPYPANFIAPLPANPLQAACASLMAPPLVTEVDSNVALLAGLHHAVLGLVNATHDLQCASASSHVAFRRP